MSVLCKGLLFNVIFIFILIAQLFLYPLCNEQYIMHRKVTLLYLTYSSASKVKMNLLLIFVACSGAMATRFNPLCFQAIGCRTGETQVPEVRTQIVNWMMESNNAQNVEMAKQLLKMMNRSKPRNQKNQRLQRYLAHHK